ncbi:MAG TPA: hypothetical protein VI408_07370 [Gaiellaceae bacterium]
MQTFPVAAPATTAVGYSIDADDVIVAVGGAWHTFAQANGGPVNVVGCSLWDFVSGRDVEAIWQLLLRHVRGTATPLTFLYRCDAPRVRRLMQMELSPEGRGGVAFCSRPVAVQKATTFSGDWSGGDLQTVVVCGWCGRVHTDDWVTPDHAVMQLGLTRPDSSWPALTHGICASCARQLRGLVRA